MKKMLFKNVPGFFTFSVALSQLLFLAGCTGFEKLAEGLSEKNLSGNGTFISTHLGLNESTRIPELKTTFISGDMASVRAGTNAVTYREESSSSIWNARCITKKRFLSITLTSKEKVAPLGSFLEKIVQQISQEK